MISHVFLDIMPFALLAALTIVGFGISFLILFSDFFKVDDKSYFSVPFKSFETLFHASLGQFDPEVSSLLSDRFSIVRFRFSKTLTISLTSSVLYSSVHFYSSAELSC